MTENKIKPGQLGKVGKAGEDAAAGYISGLGINIIDRNLKFGRLEIDLIYTEGENIVFCEVKTRSVKKYAGNSRFPAPSGAVTLTKQRKIIAAARQYLKEHRSRLYPRFDVIEVYLKKNDDGTCETQSVNLIRHAFMA